MKHRFLLRWLRSGALYQILFEKVRRLLLLLFAGLDFGLGHRVFLTLED